MKFYDLCVQSSHSGGESSVKETVEFAAKLGFSGIVICDNFESMEKLRLIKQEIASTKGGIEVYQGVKVKAETPEEMREVINKVRDHVDIVAVHGGNYDINRAACENSKVDILSHPEFERYDSGLDDVCLRLAAENNVAIGVDFKSVLYSYRGIRGRILGNIGRNIKLCREMKTNIVITSGAASVWDMRAPRELVAILTILGVDLSQAFLSASGMPQAILEENKKILEGRIITKGVEVV